MKKLWLVTYKQTLYLIKNKLCCIEYYKSSSNHRGILDNYRELTQSTCEVTYSKLKQKHSVHKVRDI